MITAARIFWLWTVSQPDHASLVNFLLRNQAVLAAIAAELPRESAMIEDLITERARSLLKAEGVPWPGLPTAVRSHAREASDATA